MISDLIRVELDIIGRMSGIGEIEREFIFEIELREGEVDVDLLWVDPEELVAGVVVVVEQDGKDFFLDVWVSEGDGIVYMIINLALNKPIYWWPDLI